MQKTKTSIYIPLFNAEEWCKKLELIPGFHYIASDNLSTDKSAAILREKGVEVISQTKNLGRLGNWQFCVDHFLASDAEWMTFLFTGDSLVPNAFESFEAARKEAPDSNIIVFQYDILDRIKQSTQTLSRKRMLTPQESLILCIEKNNWFGGVLGNFIKKAAFHEFKTFSNLSWSADYQFFIELAATNNTYYLPSKIGEFNASERKFYKVFKHDFKSLLEESLTRFYALSLLQKIHSDKDIVARLLYFLKLQIKVQDLIFTWKTNSSIKEYLIFLLRYNPLILLEYYLYKFINKPLIR